MNTRPSLRRAVALLPAAGAINRRASLGSGARTASIDERFQTTAADAADAAADAYAAAAAYAYAADAADAADDAAAAARATARQKARKRQAEKLLELLRAAPIPA